MNRQPLIGVVADCKLIEDKPFHAVGDKYLRAVTETAGGLPLIIPALADDLDLDNLIARLDGLLLPGSISNVHPRHYGQPATPEAEPFDEARDALTLPLIRRAIERGLPLLAICRGFQELNVALGGSLHVEVHKVPGRHDHRAPSHTDPDVVYGPRHSVTLLAGGQLEALAGTHTLEVNSLHYQGIERLADGLTVEGQAADGTIEAISVTDAPAFALGVQWHPEYKARHNDFSCKLFAAFAQAARERWR